MRGFNNLISEKSPNSLANSNNKNKNKSKSVDPIERGKNALKQQLKKNLADIDIEMKDMNIRREK
eukprot:CAMPEP_0116935186 /NCGR_PEP_ID=MMETSP0467-20121206/30115_1 /TAXON_ID=283647 /ORGANISM="Mesodinium pulex, Strain SPMC105" /LENGTH=64 /DNA_ID=CAMNT_0004616475 /DNA_START=535 /DNA_END=729 /DNA_ORIENTATION=-